MTDKRAAITGIGGVFFKARDPKALAAWYRAHLGVPGSEGDTHALFREPSLGNGASPPPTVWSTFPANTEYFGSGPAGFMLNYRVADLDAMLAQLRKAGVSVDDKVDESEYGRFGWATDPEGNRFELWQPPA